MSWARDEWKLDLPNTALRKISELENDVENLRKSKQQQQLQLETVSNSLQKQKQLNAEEKAGNSSLRREIQELTRKCSDLENQEEKSQIDLKAKDIKIGLLEEQLHKAREKLKEEEDKNSEMLNQVDQQKLIVEVTENEIGQLTVEVERINETKAQMVKDLEGMFFEDSEISGLSLYVIKWTVLNPHCISIADRNWVLRRYIIGIYLFQSVSISAEENQTRSSVVNLS